MKRQGVGKVSFDRGVGFRNNVAFWLGLSILSGVAAPLTAQPAIHHEDVRCVSRDHFTQLVADIEPPGNVRSAKIYFRSALYPEFYFVAMDLDQGSGTFRATLPLPSRDTTRIVYYLEAVDVSFQTTRSADLEIQVSDDCRPGPGGLLFPGENPGIVVGAVQPGLPALPAGFQATGITGFLSAAGSATGAGGGLSLPVVVGAVAGAATGVGVLVASAGDGGGPVATPSSASGAGPGAPTTSTATSGSGQGNPPPTGTTTTTTAPANPVPPSTSTSTTSSVPATLTACFEWQALGSCRVQFQSCSSPSGAIERYEWTMLGPPPLATPPELASFPFSFEGDPRCLNDQAFSRPVRLTIYGGGGSASVQENVIVRPGASLRALSTRRTLSFESQIVTAPLDGSVRGFVLVNGSPVQETTSASPIHYQLGVSGDEAVVQATIPTPAPPGALWVMDFSACDAVVPGSLRVERGNPVATTDRRVAFRLSGEPGETLMLRLVLR